MERIAILQLRARAVRRTISIAVLFGTGSVPGMPRQMGQTRVFGCPPNATGHLQNILERVANSAWTSMPMLGMYLDIGWNRVYRPGSLMASRGRPEVPVVDVPVVVLPVVDVPVVVDPVVVVPVVPLVPVVVAVVVPVLDVVVPVDVPVVVDVVPVVPVELEPVVTVPVSELKPPVVKPEVPVPVVLKPDVPVVAVVVLVVPVVAVIPVVAVVPVVAVLAVVADVVRPVVPPPVDAPPVVVGSNGKASSPLPPHPMRMPRVVVRASTQISALRRLVIFWAFMARRTT